MRGERSLKTNGVPPQVVWVAEGSNFEAPEKTRANPRALRTEVVQVTAHLWADDFDALEAMKVDAVNVVHAAAYGSYEVTSATRIQPDWVTHGTAMQLAFSFRIPVNERPKTTVVPTAFVAAPSVAGDGILDSGDPE